MDQVKPEITEVSKQNEGGVGLFHDSMTPLLKDTHERYKLRAKQAVPSWALQEPLVGATRAGSRYHPPQLQPEQTSQAKSRRGKEMSLI